MYLIYLPVLMKCLLYFENEGIEAESLIVKSSLCYFGSKYFVAKEFQVFQSVGIVSFHESTGNHKFIWKTLVCALTTHSNLLTTLPPWWYCACQTWLAPHSCITTCLGNNCEGFLGGLCNMTIFCISCFLVDYFSWILNLFQEGWYQDAQWWDYNRW